MPYLVMLIVGALTRFLPALVARVLTTLGFAVVTYASLTGVFSVMQTQIDGMITNVNGSSPIAVTTYKFLVITGGLWAIKYLLACVSARIAWKATTSFIKKV